MPSGDIARRKLQNRRLIRAKGDDCIEHDTVEQADKGTLPSKTKRSKFTGPEARNNRPIIGILSQELHKHLIQAYSYTNYKSYIAASYVKYIEAAGARVVPIRIGETFEYYEEIVNSVNGILLPGGAAKLNVRGGYAEAGILLYYLCAERQLPLWGTCLGFELIVVVAADGNDLRNECFATSSSVSIRLQKDYQYSKLFGDAPSDIIKCLTEEETVANHHSLCITLESLIEHDLLKDWRVLSMNDDEPSGLKYVSAIESNNHPIWGVQFHPEKSSYEWDRNTFSHTANAVKVTQFFSNFFVNEARKNHNSFASKKREEELLIYNHVPINTSKKGALHMQCYMFK